MSNSPKILAFAGSTRTDSYNKKLARIAAESAKLAGAEVTWMDLRDYPLPIYDGDQEDKNGLPANAIKVRALLQSHQGFLISCPEYNSSISGVLKNMVDWASRPKDGEEPLACFQDKVIGLLSASPGQLGGIRGLVAVRSLFGNIGSLILPQQVCIAKADEAFGEDGSLKNAGEKKRVDGLANAIVRLLTKLAREQIH